MEFKKAWCIITNEKLMKPILFVLKQKAWSRIKNIPFINIRSNSSWSGKWKEKFRILKEVYK